jgi:hypothetical protein
VLELTQDFVGNIGQRATMIFAGEPGTLTAVYSLDDGRRFIDDAKLLLTNVASQFTAIDFMLTLPDGDPTGLQALVTLAPPGGAANYLRVPPGEYDLYLRETTTAALLAGPTRISVAAGGVYGVLAINGPDTATAGMVLFDDFP